ncbi:diguanylate cyclase domain-containing protein [Silvibacterium sp.]|uniref:diguanylate cyclase domain-containing protein n=1 Tax=Silvibacterium sp. TaxID=1964179 RepID=UPI0039E68F59
MDFSTDVALDPRILKEVIRTQTEIARLGLDLGAVMSLVADRVQNLTEASGAIVELAEGSDMVYRAATGIAGSHLGLRLGREGSLSGLCVAQGQVLRCDDSETDDRVDRAACRRVGLRSLVVAPLDYDGTTVGVLKIAGVDANAFDEKDVAILGMMCDLIAAAMFHAARSEASELYYRATHDALTGLANRALFYDRLRQRLAQARRQGSGIGVLNLDMDCLKQINDRYGHRAGDSAIRETAQRIRNTSREADTVARLGGDEFGVILSEIRDRDSVLEAVHRISSTIVQPFQFEDHDLNLNASIGTAVYPEDSSEIDGLIEAADQAMYAAKRTRKAQSTLNEAGVGQA